MKPYQTRRAKTPRFTQAAPARSESKFLLGLTALSVLVTPIVVAIITTNANKSSTDKDYVNIAVSILNAKDSQPDNRKWAIRVLNRLSPIPFSQEGENRLVTGTQLFDATMKPQIIKVPVLAPPLAVIKKGNELVKPCPDIPHPGRPLEPDEMQNLANRLYKAYRTCQNRQEFGVTVIDILQGTADDPLRRLSVKPIPKAPPTAK